MSSVSGGPVQLGNMRVVTKDRHKASLARRHFAGLQTDSINGDVGVDQMCYTKVSSIDEAKSSSDDSNAHAAFVGGKQLPVWLERATPLVCLMGITTIHDAIVSNIPDVHGLRFMSMKMGQFHLIPKKKAQSRRNSSYEGYKPDGILPTSWLRKHRLVVPAVCVLMFEWDDDKSWEKQAEHVSNAVVAFKKYEEPREISVVVAIVRHCNDVDDDEEGLENQYRSLLCKQAGLSAESIFLLTTTDLRRSLVRLEMVMFKASQSYHLGMAKRVKKLKDKINRDTQLSLYIRHQFKIAYFYELAGELLEALKYYKYASKALGELHKVRALDDVGVLESKVVAFAVNFRIIRMNLQQGKLVEARRLFESHIQFYRAAVGPCAFHHEGFMAKQYRTFGQLLVASASAEAARSCGQNPGFYFQTAGVYAMRRKAAATSSLGDGVAEVLMSETVYPYRFVGQVPFAVSSGAFMDADTRRSLATQALVAKEAHFDHSTYIIDLLTKAYENYKMSNSTRMILHVASQMALEYYASQDFAMAKKFFDRIAKTYRKECWWKLLSSILERALDCAIRLGLRADIVRYSLELIGPVLLLSHQRRMQTLQMLVHALRVHPTQTKHMLVDGSEVVPGPTMAPAPLKLPVFPVDPRLGLVQVSVHFLVRKSASLAQTHGLQSVGEQRMAVVSSNEVVKLVLVVRSTFPESVTLTHIHVMFNHAAFDRDVADVSRASFELAVDESARFEIYVKTSDGIDLGSPLLCRSVKLELQLQKQPLVVLCPCALPNSSLYDQALSAPQIKPPSPRPPLGNEAVTDRDERKCDDDVRGLQTESFCTSGGLQIVSVKSQATVTVVHKPPALVDEKYQIRVKVCSNADTMRTPSLEMSHKSVIVGKQRVTDCVNSNDCTLLQADLPDAIMPHQVHECILCVVFTEVVHKTVEIVLRYTNADGLAMEQRQGFYVLVMPAFEPRFSCFASLTPSFLSLHEQHENDHWDEKDDNTDERTKGNRDADAFEGRPMRSSGRVMIIKHAKDELLEVGRLFTLSLDLENRTGHDLVVHRIELELDDESGFCVKGVHMPTSATAVSSACAIAPAADVLLEEIAENAALQTDLMCVHNEERITVVYRMKPNRVGRFPSPGYVCVTWRRANGDDARVRHENVRDCSSGAVTDRVVLPSCVVDTAPFSVEVSCPTSLEIGRTANLVLRIRNNTNRVRDVHISVPDTPDGAVAVTKPNCGSLPKVPICFSGRRNGRVRVFPGETERLCWCLAPLECGFVAVPRIELRSNTHLLLAPSDFGSIFVFPRSESMVKRRVSVMNMFDPTPPNFRASIGVPIRRSLHMPSPQ